MDLAEASPIPPERSKEENAKIVKNYLQKFYHLPSDIVYRSAKVNITYVIAEKIKEMQQFFGLNVTGEPDEETLEIMKKPRCGVPDTGDYMLTPGSPKWKHTDLTYRIIKYTPQLSGANVDATIEKAFQVWSAASPLTFTRILQGEADIHIAFVERDHGDNSPFDGPNGILAHAFQPGQGIGGDAHFDEEETWTVTTKGYNLFLVAAHEFGHSLGLSHSTDPGALMYPTYAFRDPSTYSLPQDDINGIQAIYGPSKNPVQPTGSTTPTACDPRLTFGAATTLRGEIFFFKDRYFWRRHPQLQQVELDFISLFWPSLPDGIQAAYEDLERDLVFLFKGKQYWALSGYDVQQGYPRAISDYGFPSTVYAIDAAVSYREKTFFFVNNQYWRYDNRRRSMDPGYPRCISSTFPGIGNSVDAAFEKDGIFFFFSGSTYYAFNLISNRVTKSARSNLWLNFGGLLREALNPTCHCCLQEKALTEERGMKCLLPLFLLFITFSSAFPVDRKVENEENVQLAQAYLNQFYSLEIEGSHLAQSQNRNLVDDKLQEMQAFFGLSVTGRLDSDTLEIMKTPRCGVPDVGQYGYTLPGWRKHHLTYRIMNYTPDMPQADVDKAIQNALRVWSEVTPLTFTKIYQGIADIMIAFRTRVHGRCPRYFDGPLGVLGHAFPPGLGLGGDTHFDEDENWTVKDASGFNLFLVAAHEFGHSLGLSHSSDQTALMFPNYASLDPSKYPLSQDDIRGIQSIYGGLPTVPTKPEGTKVPQACDANLTFDAITTLRREVMFFKGSHVWRIYYDIAEVEFELIASFWPSLPADLQAAYENPKDKILVFKDENFWMIRGYAVLPDYPKPIHTLGFPRHVKKIDAAVCDQNTRKTYFFVGIWCWRYDEMTQTMDRGFPQRVLRHFPGVSARVDAVFQHKGFFYFFCGSKQFEYDIKTKNITRVLRTNSWFKCKEPLNSSFDFSFQKIVYSGEVKILYHKSLSLFMSSILCLLRNIYSYQ
ncbi:LOW QUALITY PROTEIN: matrix metalloproteinase-27-like [Ctenodactylus gundi]